MDAEQLQAAYDKGHGAVYADAMYAQRLAAAHAAGLAEVARQQAEHDAQIAETTPGEVYEQFGNNGIFVRDAPTPRAIAAAIRAQFEKETGR